ncbi:surface-adhesin E family protein [Brevundimonas lenta]|uniref:Surface-adhesin protein E-like domain-containing protein n=1 Tax=Brevundimonas lenta TaxID=424796 RepID=A0A7W6JDB0_9CAUL|nr:surface-adhesin E family protein [Brevundimonas lenta]MBB4082063.1 hypothetical protein [Brevundimonas lenta]
MSANILAVVAVAILSTQASGGAWRVVSLGETSAFAVDAASITTEGDWRAGEVLLAGASSSPIADDFVLHFQADCPGNRIRQTRMAAWSREGVLRGEAPAPDNPWAPISPGTAVESIALALCEGVFMDDAPFARNHVEAAARMRRGLDSMNAGAD